MDLVLWRHAEAEVGEPDHGRRLTSKGEKQARRVAAWLHNRLPDSAKIVSSPARRAQQTANALVEVSQRKLKTLHELAPEASCDDVFEAISRLSGKGTVVVVGHQPALGRLASRLIDGREAEWPIKKGGLLWIGEGKASGEPARTLRAAISPDLA